MIKPAKHGRDHLFGGEDPVDWEVPWCQAYRTSSQLIDSSAEEIVFTDFYTNAPQYFTLDTSNSSGILIGADGMYQTMGKTEVGSGDAATVRQTYVQAQPQAVYPTFGSEYGAQMGFALAPTLLDDSNVRQSHIAFASMAGPPSTSRVILAAVRVGGVNYTVTAASLVIYRLGHYVGN